MFISNTLVLWKMTQINFYHLMIRVYKMPYYNNLKCEENISKIKKICYLFPKNSVNSPE